MGGINAEYMGDTATNITRGVRYLHFISYYKCFSFFFSSFKMAPHRKRLLLSKNLLEMKFMKRTKEKTEKELEDEERQTTFANEITSAMLSHGSNFIMENSYVVCENLSFGRMSFKGANVEIEKLMKKAANMKNPGSAVDQVLLDEKDADVKADEVVSLTQTIGRKFNRFNRVANSKRGRGMKRASDN